MLNTAILMGRLTADPELRHPNSAHSSKSVPASGEAILTSIGNISVISHANKE